MNEEEKKSEELEQDIVETEVLPTEEKVEENTPEVIQEDEPVQPEIQQEQEELEADKGDNEDDSPKREDEKADVPDSEDTPDKPETVPDEQVEEQKKEETKEPVKPEQTDEEVKQELDDLRYDRNEELGLKTIGEEQVKAENEYVDFQQRVAAVLEQGLRHYGIDPNISLEELQKQDVAKADIARQMLATAQERIEQKRQELLGRVGELEQNLVFNRAEREIKRFKLTPEQEIEAAKVFIKIINATGISDIGEDLKEKVRLAVASAKMDIIPSEVLSKIVEEPTVDTPVLTSDTTVLKEPTEKIETKTEEKAEEKPDDTPVVDVSDFMDTPTDTAKAPTAAKEVNTENILDKLASLPYKDRVAFMIEHQEEFDAACRKKSAEEARKMHPLQ